MTYYFAKNKTIGITHFFLERVFIGVTLKELFHFIEVVKFLFRAVSILLIPVGYLVISLFHPWLFVICLTPLLIMVSMARWFFRFHLFCQWFFCFKFYQYQSLCMLFPMLCMFALGLTHSLFF